MDLVGWPGKLLPCLLLAGVWSIGLYSQSDTVLLEAVTIRSNDLTRYLPGGKQLIIDTDSLATLSLAQAIEEQSPVYFVQYGAQGQLSSINLRGLGANRTSVRWHGMEINSFTLGQTDFSEIATGNGKQLSLQFGGVGAMFGNGSLSGMVDINSRLSFDQGHKIGLKSSAGSFGFWGHQLSYDYSGKKVSSSTSLFRRSADNDFTYDLNGTQHRQNNAGFLHYGVLQDFSYRLNARHLLTAHFWYNNHFREVQPNKNDFDDDTRLETENTRAVIAWEWSSANWFGKLRAGYTNDYQLYDNSELTRLSRWFGSYESEYLFSKYLMVRFGGNINYLKPKVDAYHNRVSETRSELYASAIWDRVKNLSLGVSFRAPMANGSFKTGTPLISGRYLLYRSGPWQLETDLQMGRSYRLPTLNDTYWQPGGNPGLLPETSINLEAGLGMQYQKQLLVWELNLRGFRHAVDNWILWIPGGRGEDQNGNLTSFWYPENIREVLAYGLEYEQTLSWRPGSNWRTVLNVSGILNHAENQNTLSPVDRSEGKQLPYTPKNILNGSLNLYYGSWNLGIANQFRSQRFVETNNELPPLPSYTLWRLAMGKSGSLGLLNWTIQFQVRNIFDRSYETFENRAMPGRNYQLNLSLNYHQNKK